MYKEIGVISVFYLCFGKIGLRFAELNISSDLIIQSSDTAKERKDKSGYLTYYALNVNGNLKVHHIGGVKMHQ